MEESPKDSVWENIGEVKGKLGNLREDAWI